MQKQQAINIVHETFESAFDKVRFTNFIKNLLNEPDLTDGFGSRSGQYIPDAYKGYVEKYERLGKYEDEDEKRIDILIVHLKRETSIERARSMQRNFVAGYLQGKFGSDAPKDAALVAFVSPNGEDWRFSLVKLEVRLDASNEGKLKVTDEFTPAKRWSFLVGSQEKSHTAQRQFVPIMQDTDNNPTLAKLEEAFNIETVTKEFFNAYRALFIRTKGELDKLVKKDANVKADFESKGIDTVNLAKKLLGQIVFLYYLQKKGWFGVPRDAAWGEGSRAFLRELFEKKHGEYKNFFNDVLEPLFYEALRIDRSHDDHYYSRFDCKIPFLNGGLFDPMNNYDWVKTDLLLPNALFSNRTKDDPEGDGILDVFDLYNFTVKEDEPFEKEVAIDPELLGKAYEKFNAIRPDNYDEFQKALKSGKKGDESKFNKQYGVYYTPREIVHYMCQQSLINYLYTELNPQRAHQGLGQGNLDMFGNAGKQGQLEITTEHAIEEISKEDIALLIQHGENWRENEERVNAAGKETETYSYKIPESIRKNASLLDEKLAAIKVCDPAVGSGAFPVGMMSEIVKSRQALLTYTKTKKTPYDFKRECIENSLYGVDIDSGAVEIAKLRLWLSLVVDEDDPQNIKPLPNLDYKIMAGNSLLGLPDGVLLDATIKANLEDKKKEYFYLTNPSEKQKLREEIGDLFIKLVKSARQFSPLLGDINFDFHAHFSEVFEEKNGFDIVIGNPPYGETIKESKEYFKDTYYSTEGKFEIFKYFIERGLKILAPQAHLTYITPDTWLTLGYFQKLRKFVFEKNTLLQITESLYNVFESATVDTTVFIIQNSGSNNKPSKVKTSVISANLLSSRSIELDINEEYEINLQLSNSIIKKLDAITESLDEYCEIWQGLIAYHSKDQPRTFSSSKKETPFHKKLLYGGDIGKYKIHWSGEWLKYGDWLHRPRPSYIFESPKILVQRIRNPQLPTRIVAAVDFEGYINGTGLSNIIIREDKANKINILFLLGLVNSSLINYWFGYHFKDVNIKPEQLRRIPVILPNKNNNKAIVTLAERILAAKGKNPQADTSKEESAIDEMVYELYGLTQEEIDIVEGTA